MRSDRQVRVGSTIDLLTTVLDEAFAEPRPHGVHNVTGAHRIALAVNSLYDSAQVEICQVLRRPTVEVDGPACARALARGVHRWAVVAEDPPQGPQVPGVRHVHDRRLFGGRPFLLVVVDRQRALVQWNSGVRADSAVLVGPSLLLDVLVDTFVTQWELASNPPMTNESLLEDGGIDHAILRMLADGATDGRIARTLHVSTRTVQRRVRGLLGELGAETRFQAGIVAAKRGWI